MNATVENMESTPVTRKKKNQSIRSKRENIRTKYSDFSRFYTYYIIVNKKLLTRPIKTIFTYSFFVFLFQNLSSYFIIG